MGCDIHLFHEVRTPGGAWESADHWEPDEDDPLRLTVPYDKALYRGRNYDLFAILADVRNGRGFAGARTGSGFQPISSPRGLPPDVDERIRSVSDSWGADGHSHSFLTVAELLAYDWTQVTSHEGMVPFSEFLNWSHWPRHHGECPDSYSSGVSGRDVKIIEMEAGDKLIEELGDVRKMAMPDFEKTKEQEAEFMNRHHGTYVLCKWSQPYYKSCRNFLSDTLPRLWRLGRPEDVRITFWFDN